MTIVDTSVWIDYLRGSRSPQTEWLDARVPAEPLGLTDLIFCELLQAAPNEAAAAALEKQLSAFDIFDMGGTELAIQAARNYRRLRAQGYTVRRTLDCLIATFCIDNEFPLLHNDRDFDPFVHLGLRTVTV